MIDDVHFGELYGSFVQPENNLPLDEDRNGQESNVQDSSVQDSNAQDRNIPVRHHGQKAVIEMLIGPWYLDEFGNPTREIRTRD